MPHLYIIAGYNGAGKTTASKHVLSPLMKRIEFINADQIASEIKPTDPESVSIQAGRIMLEKINDLLAGNADFAFETTLSTRSYQSFINRAKKQGYKVTLLFFWLPSPAMAIERVAARVARGGHHIPADIINRRYYRGIKNLFGLYMPLCDYWSVFDNTTQSVIVAKSKQGTLTIFNQSIWNMITTPNNEVSENEMPYGGQDEPDEMFDGILRSIRTAYLDMVIESAKKGETLVVYMDGEIKHMPAKDLIPYYQF